MRDYLDTLTVTGGFDGYRIGFQDGDSLQVLATFASLNEACAEARRIDREAFAVTSDLLRRVFS